MINNIRIYKKYYLNTNEFFSYDILDIKLIITHKCNYSCTYCYDKIKKNNQFLDLFAVFNFIQNTCILHKKYIVITILGGEPTLHPDLYEFCKKLQKISQILGICIYTNFSANINFYLKFIYFTNVKFILSWHIQNNIFYEKLIKLLSADNNIKTKIGLISVIYDYENISKSINIYQKIKKLLLNVCLSKIFQFNNTTMYTQQQLKILSLYNRFCSTEKSMFFDNDFFIKEQNNICIPLNCDFNEDDNYFINWKCNAGIDTICINSDGFIYPCQSLFYNNYKTNETISNYSFNKKQFICNQKICCNLDIQKNTSSLIIKDNYF